MEKEEFENVVRNEDRLPTFHRTIKLPSGLWEQVKERANQENKNLSWIVDESLDAELLPLVGLLCHRLLVHVL